VKEQLAKREFNLQNHPGDDGPSIVKAAAVKDNETLGKLANKPWYCKSVLPNEFKKDLGLKDESFNAGLSKEKKRELK
jgi:hypothetical protein